MSSNEKDRIDFYNEIEKKRQDKVNAKEAAKNTIKKSLKLFVKALVTSVATILFESLLIHYICNRFLGAEISYVQSVASLLLIRIAFRPYSNEKKD